MDSNIILSPGDRVRIVDSWANSDRVQHDGMMDHWLGQVMTVRARTPLGNYFMEEDKGENEHNGGFGWFWNPTMFAELLSQEDDYGISDCEMEDISFGDFF